MEINTYEIFRQMLKDEHILIESGIFESKHKKYRVIIELKEIP